MVGELNMPNIKDGRMEVVIKTEKSKGIKPFRMFYGEYLRHLYIFGFCNGGKLPIDKNLTNILKRT